MLLILSDLSLAWTIMGGSLRIHRVGYYFLASVIVVIWVSWVIFAESWFRTGVDEIRRKRARAEMGSPDPPEALPRNRLLRSLSRLGLDTLSRRLLIAIGFLILLLALKFLGQQFLFYIFSRTNLS